jgi:ABC-type branched-subunit amino acid transport system permease subunit
MLQSLFIFLIATVGGLTTVTGALAGGVFFALIPELQKLIHVENLQFVFIGIAAIFLANDPNGFGGNISLLGERIRARRRTRASDVMPVPEAAS